MRILIFGATGLAGSGVMRACLAAPDVTEVRSVSRKPSGVTHPKLRETRHGNYLDYTSIADVFDAVDACFFCLGLSVQQAPIEADYRRIHLEFPVAAAKMLRERSPNAQFHYLSGGRAGVDSRWMWARVKGEAERELMRDYQATCWRPAMIGGTPTASTAMWLKVLRPIMTPIFRPFKGMYIESDDIGRAMLEGTRQNVGARIFENAEIRDLADPGRRA
jgi:uncharacterized protein YbjT (DUF2867 family)